MEANTQEQQDLEAALSSLGQVAEEPAQQIQTEEAQTTQSEETFESTEETTEVEEKDPFELAEDGAAVFNLEPESATPEPSEDVTSLKEQVKALLAEKEKLTKAPKLDPRLEKMQSWLEQGNDINQAFWELQAKSYTDSAIKDPKEAIKVMSDKLRYLDNLDSDEVDYYIRKNFPITLSGDIDPDDDDYKDEQMKLRMETRQALPKLKEFQEKVLLPQVDNGQAQEELQRQISMHRAETTSKLDEIESIDFELDAEHKLRFPFKGNAKTQVKALIAEPENQAAYFQKKYMREDGSLDYAKWARSEFILNNFDGIAQAIFKLGGNSQKKAMLQELQGENAGTPLKVSKSKSKDPYAGLEKLGILN